MLALVAGPALGPAALAAHAAALPSPPPKAWWYTELDLQRAWRISQGAGVTVAVIDTGVKASLGDLRGQVLPGKDFTGRTRDARQDFGPPDNPLFGHGSLIAAQIAGTGRGAGIIGVAPKAKILPVRIPIGASADVAAAAPAIRWAVAHGADIVNMSFDSAAAPCPAAVQAAVDDAVRQGVILVAGTGNQPGPVGAPADCSGVIAVGGLHDSATFQPWSQEASGPQLDFIAPADRLVGEYLNGQLSGQVGSGTSTATALVSGTFALLRSKFPHDSARQLVTRALHAVYNPAGARMVGHRVNNRIGYGEIIPVAALTRPFPHDPTNPIYDQIQRHLDSRHGPAAAPSAGMSGPARSGSAPASAGSSTSSGPAAAGGSGFGGGAIAGIVAAVVVIAALVVVVVMRRRGAAQRPR